MGTLVGLTVIALTAYVISRKEFKCRNVVSFLIYFTTIFGGGLVSNAGAFLELDDLLNNYAPDLRALAGESMLDQ